jgi:hypothetical protein
MAAPNARRLPSDAGFSVPRSAVSDITHILAKHNPGAPRAVIERAGKAAAGFGAATASLTEEQQRKLVADKKRFARIIAAVVDALSETKPASTAEPIPVLPKGAAENSIGAGLGEIVDREEGLRRITEYATPTPIEAWAGPVAGPSELERRCGIKRSTLYEWQKRGAAIGLLKGERKHVFPLEQFIDGRPVQGMARVGRVIGNPRAAWL